MKKPFLSLAAVCGLMLSLAPASHAAGPKDYQVTGPIVSVTDTTIVVKKGQEDWELSKDAALKPADGSELKVGDKVTIHYTMAAKTVEVKKDARKEKAPPKDRAAGKTGTATPAASPAASPESSPQKPAAQVSPSPKP